MLFNYKEHRIFAFSDTHGMHNRLHIPEEANILLCAGDACMAEHGALDLLSLDGKMAVDIETEGWKIVLLSNVESTCTGDENCPLDHDSPNHLPECIGACDRSADCDATVHDKN